MAIPTSIFATDLAAVITDVGSVITFSGTNYNVLVGSVGKGKGLEIEGYYDDQDLQVIVKVSDFTTLPVVNDVLVYGGTTYRVKGTLDTPDNASLMLNCEEQTG